MTIRALLLTDVVDSTRLAEALGDAGTARLWAAHDRVARDLLPPHRGREIDKTDGFLLLFDAVSDAVAYAMAYHRAVAALDPPLRARAGLHVGPVILTENAPADVARGAKPLEVDGLAKPTAARVMGLAGGGQTLLTSQARAALGPTDLRVESHGFWRMKGVSEPVELFEVGGPDAPFAPPADTARVYRVVRTGEVWLPVRQVRHSLPTERDPFVGREADLQELAQRFDGGAHLVSVLGMGGTGKTRLVTRFAWTWLGDFPGGAWFCDLSEARGVDGIVAAVARALDVPLGKDDPVAQLGHAIAGRGPCLVVLDNFEQVARWADQTVGAWLDRAHEARFVVTTREVLGLPGETTLALAPLREAEAVDLFVARAVQARRDFTLTEADRGHVVALVRLLDALPLSIELAAARVRVMTPKVLLERMSERFRLLASTGGRHARQATLRAALDWSWGLLAPDEQLALAQLAVFEGGFTLEAAESVLALSEAWPMDAVQALVDKSLVRRVDDERFDLLVTVQEYAHEKLATAGALPGGGGGPDAVLEAERRHGAYVADRGTPEALVALDAHGGVERTRALTVDLDNLVAACRRAVARGDGPTAALALAAAWAVTGSRGPFLGAVALARLVFDAPGHRPQDLAHVQLILASACHAAGRQEEARDRFQDALERFRALGDRPQEGRLLQRLGVVHHEMGQGEEAQRCLSRAEALAREVADDRLLAEVVAELGDLAQVQGRLDDARGRYEFTLGIARSSGNRRSEGSMVSNLAVLDHNAGRLAEALEGYRAGLAIHREVGNRRFEGLVLGNIGRVLTEMGRADEGRSASEAALVIHREVGNRRSEGVTLLNLGASLQDRGDSEAARTHLDAALAIARELRFRRLEGAALGNLGDLHLAQGRLDDAERCFTDALAILRQLGDRRFEAGFLGTLGLVHAKRGRFDAARAALERSEALFRDVGDHRELGTTLTKRCLCECLAGDLDEARARLEAAERLAIELGEGPGSQLARNVARARATLEEHGA